MNSDAWFWSRAGNKKEDSPWSLSAACSTGAVAPESKRLAKHRGHCSKQSGQQRSLPDQGALCATLS